MANAHLIWMAVIPSLQAGTQFPSPFSYGGSDKFHNVFEHHFPPYACDTKDCCVNSRWDSSLIPLLLRPGQAYTLCIKAEGQISVTETQPDPNLQIEVKLVGFKTMITWVKISVNHIAFYYKMLFKVLGNFISALKQSPHLVREIRELSKPLAIQDELPISVGT